MFDSLSNRLGDVFGKLRGRGALTEADVRAAMREVRIALLEADVALPVVRSFVDQVTELAVGQNVLRSVTPGQQVVKIVSDALTEMLGSEAAELDLAVTPPAVVMMVGLQAVSYTHLDVYKRQTCNTRSPAAWPWMSLTVLKWSRSSRNRATLRFSATALAMSCCPATISARRFRKPVSGSVSAR